MEKQKAPMPLPMIDGDSKTFWEGCKEGKLLIQQCEDCENHIFYPRAVCPHCMSDRIKWVEASGKGKVYSYTVARRPYHPAFADQVPYVVALVTLDEGVRMMTNLINVDVEKVSCDMPVEVVFTKIDEQITLPKFQPLGV